MQLIEFSGTQEEFERLTDRYRELMGDRSLAQRVVLCADRERAGALVQMVEFVSYEEAMRNSDHPGTQQFAQEAAALFGEASFRNLDVLGEYSV